MAVGRQFSRKAAIYLAGFVGLGYSSSSPSRSTPEPWDRSNTDTWH